MDRNKQIAETMKQMTGSLSARRAWIEMQMVLFPAPPTMVALRKESVDRNNTRCREIFGHYESLSARRAWIEIKLSR